MGFFRFFIITFIITFISIKIFKLIYSKTYIKEEFRLDIIGSIISLFFILIYIWTIKVDELSFYKPSYLDFYFSYDMFLASIKILAFLGIIVFIVTSTSAFVYNTFYKNKKFYYAFSLFLYVLLFFIIIQLKVISFNISEPSYFFNLLPPIGLRIRCGLILGIALAYWIDYLNEKKSKDNIEVKIYSIKDRIIIVLFVIAIIFQFRNTLSLYPTYLYEKALTSQFKKHYQIKKADKYKLKDAKYDDIKKGDTVTFGRRRGSSNVYGTNYEDIEWIVLEKKNDGKEVLLLSKNGLGVKQNHAIENKVTDYKHYSSYYNSDYKYDESDSEKYDYNNSALRYEMYRCYDDFIDLWLSKDENKEYNEYDMKDNIVETYLSDTKTYEKFFPLSQSEYNKYKKMEGVGNFYFINNERYVLYKNQFRNIFYTLRTFRTKNNEKGENYEYDFLCVDTPYDALTFEMNAELIKNNNNIIGETFWFHDRYTGYYKDINYNKRTADDLYHGFVDIVLRPAMWYKCEE